MSLRRWILSWLLPASCILLSSSGFAQIQPMAPPESVTANVNAATTAFRAAAKEPGPLSAGSKSAIRLYAEYSMAKLTDTKTTPDKVRNLILGEIVVAVNSEDGRAEVAKTIARKATEIIEGRYSPQSKINAMLLLAEIDDGPKNRPQPAADARAPLYNYTKNPNVPAHLRVLAIYGLERHVRVLGERMPGRDVIAKTMVEILGSQPVSLPEEKAHWWLVRRAYDVLGTLYAAKTPSPDGAKKALEHFSDPNTIPSVRLGAAVYLTRWDLSATPDKTRYTMFVSIGQMLDQEVVGWYETEQDKVKMASGAMGMSGMGGMGGMGGMMPGTGMPGTDGGAGYDMGGGAGGAGMMPGGDGMGGMGGMGGATSGPKPIDTQKWDMRLSRRKLNTYAQVAHILLFGTPGMVPIQPQTLQVKEKEKEKEREQAKRYNLTGKGIMETPLPEPLQRPGKLLQEALRKFQDEINEKSLVDMGSLMSRSVLSLQTIRDVVETIPALEDANGSVIVPSFKQISPRVLKGDTAVLDKPDAEKKDPKSDPNKDPNKDPNAAPPDAPGTLPGTLPGTQPGVGALPGTPPPLPGAPQP